MKTTPSRRSFLKLAAACTAPAFGSLAFAAPQTKQKFDKVADVIVIGSGFAGLAAALEAKEKGASVMLLEKMPAYGGNSAINGGAFAVAGSPLQEKEGIKDSPELMLQDMIKSGRGLSHVDLLKNIVYGTRPAFDFTVKYGVIKKFDTLGELADAYGIPKEALIKQVEEFNAYVREGKDKQFDRPLALAIEIKQAPFYAARVWPKVYYCMGGVGITKNAEVLNVRTQKPIPGLYAAGEVTGGTHGASRLGGCAIADGLVTGRVAGDAVVANTPVNLE